MTLRSLKRHLKQNEGYLYREGAKHSIWKNNSTGQRSSVPRHTEITNTLVKKICKDLGMPSPFR
ncbi:MAG: type II toxin-antitoxin system HicA family toxin [Candidatus Poribacteria bacterium]|nr:type II toxin-antitoxin system HicA family toxin [Candidatus Poribacteria bacterium]